MVRINNYNTGPEKIIQDKIILKLRSLKWVVKPTHGNMYQRGFPDLFCANRQYGQRWVEVKDPNRKGDIFTPAQHEFFAELGAAGVGVWVLTSDSESEIKKLFGPPNWWQYLQIMR